MSEWGNPLVSNNEDPVFDRGVTRGTEISKYPEEKKSNEIPRVSDERKGNSPNRIFICGVVGPSTSPIKRIVEHRGIGGQRE